MKAITLWQPWASLCVLPRPCDCASGVLPGHDPVVIHRPFKTIETRSWPAPRPLIGQRIAIHAAKRAPTALDDIGDWMVIPDGAGGWSMRHGPTFRASRAFNSVEATLHVLFPDTTDARSAGHVRLPLGAIVGTAVLTDCVPIVRWGKDVPDGCRLWVQDYYLGEKGERSTLWLLARDDDGHEDFQRQHQIEDQRPFGDFAPGRWAWLLADAEAFAEPIPCRGGQRIWYVPAEIAERCDP